MFLAREILSITGITIQKSGEFGNHARCTILVRKEDTGSSVYGKTWYPGTRLTIYKSSKIFLIQPSKSDLVTVEMDGLPPAFRKWSIIAFALESIAVILAFLFMVFFLKREINVTMMYILLLVMVISAVLLIITGRPATEK